MACFELYWELILVANGLVSLAFACTNWSLSLHAYMEGKSCIHTIQARWTPRIPTLNRKNSHGYRICKRNGGWALY